MTPQDPGPTPAVTMVPAYVDPGRHPSAWRELAARPDLGLAVINPASGPGGARMPAYTWAVRTVGAHRTAGSVTTACGNRGVAEVLDEAKRCRCGYGVRAVFLDEVCEERVSLPCFRAVVDALRAAGHEPLVLNLGTVPDPAYAGLADILVTFEGT